mmetsp:Transcript_20818/g.48839  ORF Transcript_20818/g.48839 Transcript_20818/m.48839 type:complete len:238 (+) Transcript_20818:713-1426(+)
MYCPNRLSTSDVISCASSSSSPPPMSPSVELDNVRARCAWCLARAAAIVSRSSSLDENISSSSESSLSSPRVGAVPPRVFFSFTFAAASGPSAKSRQTVSLDKASRTSVEPSSFANNALPMTITCPIYADLTTALGPGIRGRFTNCSDAESSSVHRSRVSADRRCEILASRMSERASSGEAFSTFRAYRTSDVIALCSELLFGYRSNASSAISKNRHCISANFVSLSHNGRNFARRE